MTQIGGDKRLGNGQKLHVEDKRFITIDVLRGISIFFMTVIHTWTNVMDLSVFYSLDLSEINIIVVVLGILLFTLGHSRSLFLFLSALIQQFNFMQSIEKGRNPENLLVKNIMSGIFMYAMGLVRESFFNPWHGVFYIYPINLWNGSDPDGLLRSLIQSQWRGMYMFETLQIIGLALIFLTIINYIFVKLRRMKKTTKNFLFYLVFTILGFTFLFATPYMQVKISEIIGWDITAGGYYNDFTNEIEKYTRLVWYAIAGLEEPIFPNFFCVCMGCILGYRLTQPDTTKKLARRWCLVALGFILVGVHYWLFVEYLSFNMWFRVSPVWFLLINQGLYFLYLFLLMRLFEFRKSANLYRYAEGSTFLRRWGLLALTVYMLQLLDIFPRIVFTKFTGLNFVNHNTQGMLWSCILMVVAAFYFDILLRIWEKLRYILTFEWILIFLTKVISTLFSVFIALFDVIVWMIKKLRNQEVTTEGGWSIFTKRIITTWKTITFSRIEADKSLYNVEPYFFIQHESKREMIATS